MSQIRTSAEKNLKSMAKVIINDWIEFIDLLGLVQQLNSPIVARSLPYVDDLSARLSEALRSSSDISNTDFGVDGNLFFKPEFQICVARMAMKVSLEETAIVIHQILQVFAIENIHKMPGTLACIQVDRQSEFQTKTIFVDWTHARRHSWKLIGARESLPNVLQQTIWRKGQKQDSSSATCSATNSR